MSYFWNVSIQIKQFFASHTHIAKNSEWWVKEQYLANDRVTKITKKQKIIEGKTTRTAKVVLYTYIDYKLKTNTKIDKINYQDKRLLERDKKFFKSLAKKYKQKLIDALKLSLGKTLWFLLCVV